MSEDKINDVYVKKDVKFLYVSPEKILMSELLKIVLAELATKGLIQRIVIDEAHCVQSWGIYFRPPFQNLSIVRELCPGVPIVALSATVRPCDRLRIVHHLRLAADTKWFVNTFNRPNLQYIVLDKSAIDYHAIQQVAVLVKTHYLGKTGIVYCRKRLECHDYADALNTLQPNTAEAYHAHLSDDVKLAVQQKWMKGEVSHRGDF